ncbi:Hypothetical predicted protein [Xyrichtys novacula]|uniref:MHC class I antigen n=1 Tax=Xyrichtys novacula TaxID=13765 RepID=A0AAV1HPG1_XYRNO|nr:Hypothetical predicted protein [Xyrichtys novacula]
MVNECQRTASLTIRLRWDGGGGQPCVGHARPGGQLAAVDHFGKPLFEVERAGYRPEEDVPKYRGGVVWW